MFRKPTLLLNNVLAIGGSLMMVFSSGFSLLIAGRFIMGVNGGRFFNRQWRSIHMSVVLSCLFVLSGFNSSVASMYLSEIAPVRLRGVFGTVCQLGITTFIFLSQLFGLPEVRTVLRDASSNTVINRFTPSLQKKQFIFL